MNNEIDFFIINPFEEIKEKTQELYLQNKKIAYNILIESLCIPDPLDLFEEDNIFLYGLNCDGDSDFIEIKDYQYKFKKTSFFDFNSKSIKNSLENYYDNYNIKVTKLFRDDKTYYIELTK